MFTQAQVRILLSDTALEITNLPGVSPGAPTALAGASFGPPGALVPVGRTPAPNNFGVRSPTNTSIQSGFIKIEYRNAAGGWVDVTAEWLNLGFTKRNIDALNAGTTTPTCPNEPNPNAIIRFQRVRADIDNATFPMAPAVPVNATNRICGVLTAGGVLNPNPNNYWPLTLYDVRESWPRDNLATDDTTAGGRQLVLGGVMHYIELDVNNLRRWLANQIGPTAPNGPNVATVDENGYALYFSDRRNNKNGLNETGEYGYEDFVNPGDVANGAPNGGLDSGEDLNSNNALDNYGMVPPVPAGGWALWEAPFTTLSRPRTILPAYVPGPLPAACRLAVGACPFDIPMNKARSNPAILFRRALKLVNGVTVGAQGALPTTGLTIASENPVYVEGHYNATAGAFGTPSAPAAILADAITLLSANWSTPMQLNYDAANNVTTGHGDTRSFTDPNDTGGRPAASTRYRFAALAGKIRQFTQPNLPASFGTDGGIHNFLRLVEDWNGDTLSYRGSVASFYYSRQQTGLFRCCTNVYQLPTRDFVFDTNFLNPQLLPPKTPMFRDVNTTRFRYVTR